MEAKLLVTVREAAQLLSIGESTLWRDSKIGKLPAPVKIGGATRWRVADLHTFVANAPTVGGYGDKGEP